MIRTPFSRRKGGPTVQRRSVIALAVDLAEHGIDRAQDGDGVGDLVPGRMSPATARFEKDAPRHFIR